MSWAQIFDISYPFFHPLVSFIKECTKERLREGGSNFSILLWAVLPKNHIRNYRADKIVGGCLTYDRNFGSRKRVESGRVHWRCGWLSGLFLLWRRLFVLYSHMCHEWRRAFHKRWIELQLRKPLEGEIWDQNRVHIYSRQYYIHSSISMFWYERYT